MTKKMHRGDSAEMQPAGPRETRRAPAASNYQAEIQVSKLSDARGEWNAEKNRMIGSDGKNVSFGHYTSETFDQDCASNC